MNARPEYVRGKTIHARRGCVANRFSYGVDYLLIDPESREGPLLYSRNRMNLVSVHDRHHGGERGSGRGLPWAREILRDAGADEDRIRLLAQPRFLGYVFNPVSFWLAYKEDALIAVIAEVNNTFGDRHSYFCHNPGFSAITPQDRFAAKKVFHVSPFQDIRGQYCFAFDIRPDRIAIRISALDAPEGVLATLAGTRAPLTNRGILLALLRRPFGPLRTIALIHLQAAILGFKGAKYRKRPEPPNKEITHAYRHSSPSA